MGDPAKVLLKVAGDDREHWLPVENVPQFIERMNNAGLRVTKPASLGPLPTQRYGPEEPSLDQDVPPSPIDINKLPTQKSVPPQPYFPPKGSTLAAVPLDAGVPAEAGAATASVAEAPSVQVDPELERARKALAASRAREAAAARGDIPHGTETIGRGIGAPKKEKPSELESFGRGYADQAGFGLGDEAAGGWAMASELVPRVADAVSGFMDPGRVSHYARTTQRGYTRGDNGEDVTPLGPQYSMGEAVARAGEQAMSEYAKAEDVAREANPVAYTGGSMLAAVPQSVAMRWLTPGATGAAQAEAAAARSAAAGGTESWALRTLEGARDALFNPGNVASAALSGAGHVRHDAGESALDYAAEAGAGTAGELAFGVMAAPFATSLLAPFRALGRNKAAGLLDPLANPETSHLHRAARNAGATYETFHKPLGRPGSGHPLTGSRGLRPGEDMRAALQDADVRGAAQPVEQRRLQVADRVANVLENEAERLDLSLPEARKAVYSEPASGANLKAFDKVLASAPHSIRDQVLEEIGGINRERVQQGRSKALMDAEMLDQLIEFVDDWGNTHRAAKAEHLATPFAKYSRELRQIRRDHFKSAAWTAETHADAMREHEAKKTAFGIPANTKGVDTTPRSKDIQTIDQQLSRGQPPILRETIGEMERTDPEVGKLLRQWSGLDAQQRLLTGVKEEAGPITVRNAGLPTSATPGFSARLLDRVSPGMRFAGLENLGENSHAGVRGGLAAAAPAFTGTPTVTPEQVVNLAARLGYSTTPTAEELERIHQLLGLHPERMNQYRQPP